MNSSKVLATEFGIAIAFNVYGAVKAHNVPWPPTIVRIGIAYGLLGVLAVASEELAALMGAGFLLALAIKAAGKQGNGAAWTAVFGANPPNTNTANFPYYTLKLPGASTSTPPAK